MKKHGLFARAAAVAALSVAIGAPAIVGLTAGTASARPMCDAIGDYTSYAWERHEAAVAAYQHSEAAFWLREWRASRNAYKKEECNQ